VSLAISIHSLSGQVGGSFGSAAESGSRILVTALLSEQSQRQERFVIFGIEIDRSPETVFSSSAFARGVADHSHQTISGGGKALLSKMPLAKGDCLHKTPLVGQLRRSTQQESRLDPMRN
jgi:hypothetical protein